MAAQTVNPPAETDTETPEAFDPFAALDTPGEHDGDPGHEVPEAVERFVQRGLEFWKAKPRKWQAVDLKTEAEVKRIRGLAKTAARRAGLVFRVKTTTDKHLLVYRVTSAPPVKTDPEPESADGA
jgi:hypothetical protein